MAASEVQVTLDAVIVAVTDETPRVLSVLDPPDADPGTVPTPFRLPSGLLDADDRTLERAVRRFVRQQAGLEVGYVEQLYTFGDLDRSRSVGRGLQTPGDTGNDTDHDTDSMADCPRQLSIAYLALVRESRPSAGAAWLDWYDLYPWEDHRSGAARGARRHGRGGGAGLDRCRPRRRRAGLPR